MTDDDVGGELATLTPAQLRALANTGDRDALNELAKRFADDPGGVMRECRGDLPALIEEVVVASAFEEHAATRLAVRARMAQIRKDLEGSSPTPLEKLLAERIALTWLDLYILEMWLAINKETQSVKVLEARGKRLERAERRYLRCLKALADVRKTLHLTAINIALPRPQYPGLDYAAVLGRPTGAGAIEAAPDGDLLIDEEDDPITWDLGEGPDDAQPV